MSEENWDEGEAAVVGGTDLAAAPTAEMPEVKLFGRWSCDDVQVSDMSLQVCVFDVNMYSFPDSSSDMAVVNLKIYFSGLHCSQREERKVPPSLSRSLCC